MFTLNEAANGTNPPTGQAQFTIYHGIYRLVGVLFTSPTAAQIVNFKQDNDTFYLQQSVQDITSASSCLSSSMRLCALTVPCGNASCSAPPAGQPGLQVEALGRVVGGNTGALLVSSPDQSDQTPSNMFTSAPGYSTLSSTTSTSFPFRLYTNTTGQIRAHVTGSSPTAYEVTDGWVFRRMQ
jgi:hypothetical protein